MRRAFSPVANVKIDLSRNPASWASSQNKDFIYFQGLVVRDNVNNCKYNASLFCRQDVLDNATRSA